VSLVALLKGINVGGHRTFRPSVLAAALKRFDVVNVGAAGTFVVRAPIGRTQLRAELVRRLPFEADIMICDGRDILSLVASAPFKHEQPARDIVQFVSVLGKRSRSLPAIPLTLPTEGEWGLRVLEQRHPFVIGVHRPQMKAIGHLAQLEKLFGVAMTTRSWSTYETIARILNGDS
jgi:uncharacterized protein (DUF1697 family)